jgi:hypothetical protein
MTGNNIGEDHYVQTFMGTTYDFGRPRTIRELKNLLEEIVSDLPADQTLKISEIDLRDGKLGYTLVDGVVQ